jgi:hypothetical protein
LEIQFNEQFLQEVQEEQIKEWAFINLETLHVEEVKRQLHETKKQQRLQRVEGVFYEEQTQEKQSAVG